MNSLPRVLRRFFSWTARRTEELHAPDDRGSSIASASSARVASDDDDEQTIDLLRGDTLTSAPSPKLR